VVKPMPEDPRAVPRDAVGVQVRVPKAGELIANHLRRQIVRGQLREGDALPPENELMQQFKVSRPTLREAFRVLEHEGLITVHRGAHGGARVHLPDSGAAARYMGHVLEHRGTTIADVLQARAGIEAPCARMVAEGRSRKDLARLRECLAAGADGSIDDPAGWGRTSTAFHQLLVELSGNQTLALCSGMLRHLVERSSTSDSDAGCGAPADERAVRAAGQTHTRLVELIAAGDGDGAETLWAQHLVEGVKPVKGTTPGPVLDLLG
jgi:GntR family transcriptional regulator, transcriptional repressor for pyruvate dehydrogenase complex